jgi:predicted nuclease of predicted toxin-antitoxin system
MKFLIDADVPGLITKTLALDHDVIDIRDIQPPATPDIDVYHLASTQDRIIITRDLDFSNILLYPPPPDGGIIVLRVHLLTVSEIVSIIKNLIKQVPEKEIIGSLIIARKDHYRLRKP